MKSKNFKFICSAIVFLIILAIIFTELTGIMIPKFFYDNDWATTNTYTGFYKMKKDTVDVLFLGSSHAASAFDTQELYDEEGIRSYNLACEEQNVLVSYYWLKEALKYQSPKAVILDSFLFFDYKTEEPLNSEEACTRKAIDFMKNDMVKLSAIKDITDIDKNQDILSYFMPNIRFHSRWEELSKDDFNYKKMEERNEMKGYSPLLESDGSKDFEAYSAEENATAKPMAAVMELYLKKIVELCREKNITLILVKTPTESFDMARHKTVQAFADAEGVPFIDYNEKDTYSTLDFDFAEDMNENEHANMEGARKLTDDIGKRLHDEYEISAVEDKQWSSTEKFHDEYKEDYKLHHEEDIYKYFEKLDNDRYSIFIAAKGNSGAAVTPKLITHFKKIGLNCSFARIKNPGYAAAVVGRERKEVLSTGLNAPAMITGVLPDGVTTYKVTSQVGSYSEYNAEVEINNDKCSTEDVGINITVYDNTFEKVIDKVCFDTSDSELKASR